MVSCVATLAPHAACVLCCISSISAVGSDQFDSVLPKFCVQFIGVISVVTDQVLRCFRDNHLDKRGSGQFHFVRCSAFDVHGNGETVAVCNGHDLRSLATAPSGQRVRYLRSKRASM